MYFSTLILDALLPRQCVGCHTFDTWLCNHCVTDARSVHHIELALSAVQKIHTITTVGSYAHPVWREAIGLLKFHHIREIAKPIGAEIARTLHDVSLDSENLVLVPIPLHPRRLRERGFNQSLLIAQAIHTATGIPVVSDVLIRTQHTRSQTLLNFQERYENVHGAFAVRPIDTFRLEHIKVLLVDDVLTTGATVSAAATALEALKPASIHALGVARGFAL